MRILILILCFSVGQLLFAQETFTPKKSTERQIVLDGLLSEQEWSNAVKIPLDIEFSPANNEAARKETTAYVTYSDTHLFVGIYAKDDPKNIRASIRPRDDFSIWNDDVIVLIAIRSIFGCKKQSSSCSKCSREANSMLKQVNALSDSDRYDSTFNINFESKAAIIEDGYTIEMKIPFSEIPFPNGTDQEWHINFYRTIF